MERDFLGLSSKDSVVAVKEEINNDGGKESGYAKGSGIQWPFSNKVSALPHLMSFRVGQEDKTKKESLMVPGFLPISAAEAFEQTQKRSMAEIQTLAAAPTKQPLLGGIPVLATANTIAGSWNNVKGSGSPPQLTVFYAGTVYVYDNISPEKAQAIMFLAENGSSMASNTANLKAQVQAQGSQLAAGDGLRVTQPINTPNSALSSPLSVSSHTGPHSGSGSTSTDDLMAAKTTGVPTTPVSKIETPKIIHATAMMPSAVPQARKASLARFLEKRKERVMNTAPYSFSKKSLECTESNGANFIASTIMDSFHKEEV